MIGTLKSRGSARSVAIFVRLLAFLVTAVSVVLIPSALAAAAIGHVTADAAFTTAGAAAALSLLASLAARSLDPLRA